MTQAPPWRSDAQSYPGFPGTTPNAGPPFPNIACRSDASAEGCSCAAKWPPASWSDSNTTFPACRAHLQSCPVVSSERYGSSRDARFGEAGQLLGKVRQAARNGAPRAVGLLRLGVLVVDPHRCCWPCPREPVHRDPRQYYEIPGFSLSPSDT